MIDQRLAAYHDGELGASEEDRVRRMVETDPRVSSELSDYATIDDALTAAHEADSPSQEQLAGAKAKLQEKLHRTRPMRSRVLLPLGVACAAAAAALVIVVLPQTGPDRLGSVTWGPLNALETRTERPLHRGSTVRSGASETARIRLGGVAEMDLGPESELTILGESRLRFADGALRLNASKETTLLLGSSDVELRLSPGSALKVNIAGEIATIRHQTGRIVVLTGEGEQAHAGEGKITIDLSPGG